MQETPIHGTHETSLETVIIGLQWHGVPIHQVAGLGVNRSGADCRGLSLPCATRSSTRIYAAPQRTCQYESTHLMDTQSVGPSSTDLPKKPLGPGSSTASLAAHCKKGSAVGHIECRQPTVSCSFTFEGRSRRSNHLDHQLSKSLPHYGSTAPGGEPDNNSWLVIPSSFTHLCGFRSATWVAIRCSVGASGSCGVCVCQQSLDMNNSVALDRSAAEAQPMLLCCGLSPLAKARFTTHCLDDHIRFIDCNGPVCGSSLAFIFNGCINDVLCAGKKRLAPGKRKHVMVLMSDTGGGHRASAEALQAGFEQLYGNDFQVSPR